jgi:hypothetical protein
MYFLHFDAVVIHVKKPVIVAKAIFLEKVRGEQESWFLQVVEDNILRFKTGRRRGVNNNSFLHNSILIFSEQK